MIVDWGRGGGWSGMDNKLLVMVNESYLRMEKSAFVVLKVCNHLMPKTTYTPSIGKRENGMLKMEA